MLGCENWGSVVFFSPHVYLALKAEAPVWEGNDRSNRNCCYLSRQF